MDNILRVFPTIRDDIVQAKGDYLITSKGERILDLQSGIWCTNIGHQPDVILNVIRNQIENTIHLNSSFTPMIASDLALKLSSLMGIKDGKGIFLSSGSEAVEFAIRVASLINDKKKLTFKGSYLSAYQSNGYTRRESKEWIELEYQECLSCTAHNCNECNLLSHIDFSEIGVFVLEALNSRMSIMMPDKLVRHILTNLGDDAILIANEVTTGIGRAGKWFGFQHYEYFKPDIVTLGKGLGNGYPISGVIVSGILAEKIQYIGFKYIQSHQNDPLGCHIALEVLNHIDEYNLIDESMIKSKMFVSSLSSLQLDYITEIRNHGYLISIEVLDDICQKLGKLLLDKGYFVGVSGNIIHLAPSLTIDYEELSTFIDVLIEFNDNL